MKKLLSNLLAREEPVPVAPEEPSAAQPFDFDRTTGLLERHGRRRKALLTYHVPQLTPDQAALLSSEGVEAVVNLHQAEPAAPELHGLQWVGASEAPAAAERLDGFIIYDPIYDAPLHAVGMRPALSNVVKARDIPIIFSDPDTVFPKLKNADTVGAEQLRWIPWQYCVRSGLKGHFLEFGVWFGRNFFKSCKLLGDQLEGKFFAFDSFGGLSTPKEKELEYTAGDFEEGRYFCNRASFNMIREQLSIPESRVVTVPGYYEHSIRGKRPEEFGIEPRSVSLCLIDCDLYEPTVDVLDFVFEALDDGALLYFDDLRLSRAANRVGEFDAMRRWLKKHPEVELVELFREEWQHQWYIFNRYD